VALLLIVWSIQLFAQTRPPVAGEHEIKAAYLFQFGRYIEWPPGQEPAGFVICVLGRDPFGDALDKIVSGKLISGHSVGTRRIFAPTGIQDCQVIFVSPSEDERLPAILDALKGSTVLTVGDGASFTQQGGMVGFILTDRKVRFVVNLAAAEAAQLKLSSQLLRLAVSVER
jgi:hypothetical protein